jgi:hypothetical protein
MKIFLTIIAVISFLMMIPISLSYYDKYQVYTKGHIVNVTITKLPNLSYLKSDFMKFSMDGKIYDKRIRAGKFPYKVGDTIQLKYLKGYEVFFLFPNENPNYWAIILLIFFPFCGCYLLYYVYREKRKE